MPILNRLIVKKGKKPTDAPDFIPERSVNRQKEKEKNKISSNLP